MKCLRLAIAFGLLSVLFAFGICGQLVAANPFDLVHRLPTEARLGDSTTTVRVNPFDVMRHRTPDVRAVLGENTTTPFRPFSVLPRGNSLPNGWLFGVLVTMFALLTLSVAANRSAVTKAWRAFLNDNALALAQREASGIVGSTPYYLLYGSFLLNVGMFIFLVTRVLASERFNNLPFLLICFAAGVVLFLGKHLLVGLVRSLFPVDPEGARYSFLMVIFNCVLGLFLLPFNFLIAFGAEGPYRGLFVFWALGLIAIFYVYRSVRALSVGSKFLGGDLLHFLLYLCAIEIAPVLLLVKLGPLTILSAKNLLPTKPQRMEVTLQISQNLPAGMSATPASAQEGVFKKVQNILISQAKPAVRTQYDELEKRFDVRIDFVPFVTIEGLTEKEYRKNRVYPNDYTAIIFTSKNAVDHFFRLCGELRIKMSEETKYFCATETIANYLQKFIMFRKRKVFNGTKSVLELKAYILRHKEEKFFLPCNDQGNPEVTRFFKELKVPIQEAVMYRSVNNDLSNLKDVKFDIIAFFSALEIKSMFEQFPDFRQEDRRICVFGPSAHKAVTERGMTVSIQAGTPEAPSIAVALENYLKVSNKK